jgi:hypothetical protein
LAFLPTAAIGTIGTKIDEKFDYFKYLKAATQATDELNKLACGGPKEWNKFARIMEKYFRWRQYFNDRA